jgi:hypothetical protein
MVEPLAEVLCNGRRFGRVPDAQPHFERLRVL